MINIYDKYCLFLAYLCTGYTRIYHYYLVLIMVKGGTSQLYKSVSILSKNIKSTMKTIFNVFLEFTKTLKISQNFHNIIKRNRTKFTFQAYKIADIKHTKMGRNRDLVC